MDSSTVTFDDIAASEIVFKVLTRIDVAFQFPPKIITDSNSSSWLEKDIWAIEMLRIHRGSIGRKITTEWEYVATDSQFNATYIAQQLRNLKAYYFAFGRNEYPIIEMQYQEVVPVQINFRLRDHSIQYSREIVENGGRHPLHTKVTATLEVATTVNISEADKDKVKQKPLIRVNKMWY